MDLYNTKNGSEVLTNISTFINTTQKSCRSFQPTSSIVVEWRDTCPYENNSCSLVSVLINKVEIAQALF